MSDFKLPNIRKLFIPDKGYMLFDADLSGADGQVVAWEANDPELKKWLTTKEDMHLRHAVEVGGETHMPSLDPKSHDYYVLRQGYKRAVHLTNYGGSAKVLAMSNKWSMDKAAGFQRRYFTRRPGVQEWHQRTMTDLKLTRTVHNRFGYRIIYFDRVDGLLPQALAWVPQSTIALVCFRGALRLRRELPWVQILMQVHDSLVFQVPIHRADDTALIHKTLEIEIPYPNDPLVIPWGLARSEKSWGDCEKVA